MTTINDKYANNNKNTYIPATLARNMNSQAAYKLVADLKMQTLQLTQKDIRRWRQAWQLALSIENPKRYDLLSIYDDVMIDLHLTGAIQNRKLAVMSKNFKIVGSKDNKENTELTKLFKNLWFKQFISLSLDSAFYGHSLIQFDDIITEPVISFKKLTLVPRQHVCPEYSVLLRETSDEPKKGIDYTIPPFSDWSIPVSYNNDLGLLLKIAPQAIAKKNQLLFWDQFGEIFGMPIRVATTQSRDPKEHIKIENMMEQMGTAPWGLFPDGTTIQLIESTRGDAFRVYDQRVIRANSEMSKAILGQTMTMDDGSSLSQAQVHERVADNILFADSDWIKDVVNDQLFPFLIKHNFPVAGYSFSWDDTYEFTQAEMAQVENVLLQNYDIDPKYFAEKYNIPITGIKQTQIPANNLSLKKKK